MWWESGTMKTRGKELCHRSTDTAIQSSQVVHRRYQDLYGRQHCEFGLQAWLLGERYLCKSTCVNPPTLQAWLTCSGDATLAPKIDGSVWVEQGSFFKLESCPAGYYVFPASVDAANAGQQECLPCIKGEERTVKGGEGGGGPGGARGSDGWGEGDGGDGGAEGGAEVEDVMARGGPRLRRAAFCCGEAKRAMRSARTA